MTSYEFIALDINERAEVLWEKGQFIDNSEGAVLYFLGNFYVEVIVDETGIIEIAPFKQGYRLGKYLENITLPLDLP